MARSKYTASKDLLLASGFSSKEIAGCVAQLKDKDRLVATASLVIDAGYWQRQVKAALSILGKEHSHYPLKEGLSRAELQSRLALPREVFNHLLDSLVTSGQVVRREDAVALASHKPKLSPPQERLVSKIMALFKESGSSPPDRKELIQKVPGAEGVVRFMCQQGMLVELPDGVLLEGGQYEAAKQKIIDFLTKNGQITIQDVSSLFGFSRKYSIPLLTQLDTEGVTRRRENVRILARKPV